MFFLDISPAPTVEVPVLVAQADYGVNGNVVMQDLTPHTQAAPAPAAGTTPQPDYLLTGCKETESSGPIGDPRSVFRAVSPGGMLANYLNSSSDKQVVFNLADIKNVTLLQDTQHGKITSVVNNTGRPWYRYDATPNYIGKDRAVFLAQFEGKVYKIVINLVVSLQVNENPLTDEQTPVCPEPTLIKVTKPSSGDSGFGAGYNLSSVPITFADLAGAAVGQTNASGITLDPTAAGYNWFIDTTPADNSEYLPTSNPYEWVAKAGSAAYGKMDMLSVLLHEYGHALGIEHSADGHDYMGTTLTSGVRRLPSAEEMALMQQLIAQAKGDVVGWASAQQVGMNSDLPSNAPSNSPLPLPIPLSGLGLSFLGFLRSSRYGGASIEPDYSTLVTQYAVAANATLTNGSLNAADGWSTQGSVNIGNGAAVLNEVSTSQTRLSQVFMLNDKDRYLSFTLSGTALRMQMAATATPLMRTSTARTASSITPNDGQLDSNIATV